MYIILQKMINYFISNAESIIGYRYMERDPIQKLAVTFAMLLQYYWNVEVRCCNITGMICMK